MMTRTRIWLLLVLLAITPLGARAQDWAACREAVEAAEREAALPPGLLHAIARTESGRRDPATGRVEPWPWALNAAGMGMHAPSRAEAIATVAALQARGIRSIDVGCLQVNLLHHPGAFASLEEAFEPAANARYAARFLRELQGRAGGDVEPGGRLVPFGDAGAGRGLSAAGDGQPSAAAWRRCRPPRRACPPCCGRTGGAAARPGGAAHPGLRAAGLARPVRAGGGDAGAAAGHGAAGHHPAGAAEGRMAAASWLINISRCKV